MKRRKRILSVLAAAVLGASLVAAAALATDIKQFPSCPICGMNRLKFNFSRVYTVFTDGSKLGTCSVFCLGAYMVSHLDKIPKTIQVADFFTKKLIDAQTAVWVINDKKPGVMTKKGKWAFATKAGARKYIAKSGGRIVGYDRVMQDVFCGMYADLKMIQEKRRRMRMMKLKKKGH